MRRYLLPFWITFFSVHLLFAQEEKQIPFDLLDDILTQIAENREEEVDETVLYDDLMSFLQNPIDLNHTNREELGKLQFLTSAQIENILAYVRINGAMQSLYEIQLVDGLYAEDIRFMLPFVTILQVEKKPVPLKFGNVFRYGKHEVLTRWDRVLETREGFKAVSEEEQAKNPNKQFVGDSNYASLRYRFNYSNRVSFGFATEKDAGEQFWGAHNKGMDFYSLYVQLNDVWKFKTIVAGNYSVAFGQGLVINQSYGFGKSSMVMNVEQRNEGLRKYTSVNEYNFMQGVGATLKLGKTRLTAFYSNKKIDGDTINGTFSSIKTDGIHATVGELNKKYTIGTQVIGANIAYSFHFLKLGFTIQNTQLDHTLTPRPAIYNSYYFSGKRQTAGSVDYKLRWRKLYLFGETAMLDKSFATLNGITVSPISTVSLILLYRYYTPGYDVLLSSAFGETSRVNNENGLYVGAEVRPFPAWKFSAYADAYSFPWIKYGINTAGTSGYDLFFQADYVPKQDVTMFWRIKFESKAANMTDSLAAYSIGESNRGNLRYGLQYSLSSQLKLRNVIEATFAKNPTTQEETYGYLFRQDISYSFAKIPLSFDVAYAFFDAPHWENRIYANEQDILYTFSVPALSGIGSRYYINAKYAFNDHLTLYVKVSQTVYLDRNVVGTDLNAIDGNRRSDVRLLVKWRF